MEKPFNTKQLAERWHVSEVTVRNMIKSGAIKAFKLGGKLYRIPFDEVMRKECDLLSIEEFGRSITIENARPFLPRIGM